MTTQTESSTRSRETAQWSSAQLGLGIVGAALGTAATSVVTPAPGWKVAIAVVGAIVPVLISTAGKYHALRIVTGVGLTAFVVTYFGFTAVNFAADTKATFPLPSVVEDPAKPGGPLSINPGENGGPVRPVVEGATIAVSPEQLSCSSAVARASM